MSYEAGNVLIRERKPDERKDQILDHALAQSFTVAVAGADLRQGRTLGNGFCSAPGSLVARRLATLKHPLSPLAGCARLPVSPQQAGTPSPSNLNLWGTFLLQARVGIRFFLFTHAWVPGTHACRSTFVIGRTQGGGS